MQWFQALLTDCEAPRHGVDLFGRDSLLLGRLLATLGRFVVAAAPASVTAQLASATIELLRAPQVSSELQSLNPSADVSGSNPDFRHDKATVCSELQQGPSPSVTGGC